MQILKFSLSDFKVKVQLNNTLWKLSTTGIMIDLNLKELEALTGQMG